MIPIVCGNATTSTDEGGTIADTRAKEDDGGGACDIGVELSLLPVDDYDFDEENAIDGYDGPVDDDEGDNETIQGDEDGLDVGEGSHFDDSSNGETINGVASDGGDNASDASDRGRVVHPDADIIVPIVIGASMIALAVAGFISLFRRRRARRQRVDGDGDGEGEHDNEKGGIGHGGNFNRKDINKRGEDEDEYQVVEGLLPAGFQRSDCVNAIDVSRGDNTDSSSDNSVRSQSNFSWI
ncbi:hypothetical protein ACHAXA_007283 [Cyclostephanos tholiformis]|uniref:Uncharacterized protein n=1 Tax=Cyclostephanos tholiformis TaxID=382380 RepID=A0ABD3SGM4_9STRA